MLAEKITRCLQMKPVIPAIQEAEVGDAQVQAGQLNETLSKRGRG